MHQSPVCHPNIGAWSQLVHLKMTPYIFAPSNKIAKRLWIGFGGLCGHAKPWLDCECQFKRCPRPLRCAPLKPLTRLNWRLFITRCAPVWGGQAQRAKRGLTASNRQKIIVERLQCKQSAALNWSQASFLCGGAAKVPPPPYGHLPRKRGEENEVAFTR